jgi:hypothetical protein
MTPIRTKLRLAAGVLVLLVAGPAFAQELGGAQLFAPADISPYGRGPQANQGYFFVFDGLYWSVSVPKTTTIGDANSRFVSYGFGLGLTEQISTLDTGYFKAAFNPGQRVEFGRVIGHHGWFFSTFRTNNQTQDPVTYNVPMTFKDPGNRLWGGLGPFFRRPLPVQFGTVTVRNENEILGVELNYLRRMHAFHNGSVMEWFFGVRYFEFNEDFNVDATGGILDDSRWYTKVQNHIIAPQFGLRWFRKYPSRWMLSAEGRFFEGYNSQNFSQEALLGGQLTAIGRGGSLGFPDTWYGQFSTTHAFRGEWFPAVEFRFDVRYQMTRAVSLRAGWTAIWLDGIARAPNAVNYEIPAMGIDLSNNRQGLFVHGAIFGIDVNR